MSQPLVSIITPTFNRAGMLPKCIESNIAQTYPFWEQIIVDDNSTDNTEEVVKSYMLIDSRIKYYKNPGKGAPSARNYGFEKSKGDYIAFIDDDDINLPHRFDSQIKAAKKSGSNYIVSGIESRELASGKLIERHVADYRIMGSGFGIRWLLSRKIYQEAGGWDITMPAMQEIEFSYRLGLIETYIHHDDIVSVVYGTPQSISRNVNSAIKGKILVLEKHETIMPSIEAAWWYYNITLEFIAIKKFAEARYYLNKSIGFESRFFKKIILQGLKLSLIRIKIVRKLIVKVLSILYMSYFPMLVKHKVITIDK
jgi:glycosyltransferase involved in cell wall biosynthesis